MKSSFNVHLLILLLIATSCSRQIVVQDFKADWTARGESPDSAFGHRAMGLGDVNGDGYDDLMVTAPRWNKQQGQVYVYHGGPKGPSAQPAWKVKGQAEGDVFGDRGGQAGDLNHDGFADAFVAAPAWKGGLGKVYVYHGSASGLGNDAAWEYSPKERGEQFGDCTHPTGDLNGDGFDDLAVGAFGHDKDRGRVLLFLGGKAGLAVEPVWVGQGQTQGEQFGYSPGAAGDVNGDGIGDLLVGAKFARQGDINVGKTYLFLGARDGKLKSAGVIVGKEKDGQFGTRVHGLGDMNGDGYGDVLISAPGASSVFVFNGNAAGLNVRPAVTVNGTKLGLWRFGLACAPAGDMDGDGRQEWMAYGADNLGFGQWLLFKGDALLGRWRGGSMGGRFAAWSAPAGDLNGDGAPDGLACDPSDSAELARAGAVFMKYGTKGRSKKQPLSVYLNRLN